MTHFAVARQMGITEEELAEAVHLAGSVGAGTIVAMADRASRAAAEKAAGNKQ